MKIWQNKNKPILSFIAHLHTKPQTYSLKLYIEFDIIGLLVMFMVYSLYYGY